MNTVTHTLSNGNIKTYQVVNGTYYDARTPAEVVRVLEAARQNGTRIRIHYGTTDASTPGDKPVGTDWHDEYDVTGTVSRSMGPIKIPLLIGRNQDGGPGLLDHCIVRIRTATRDLYRHPAYRQGTPTVEPCDLTVRNKTYRAVVKIDGHEHARFETADKAKRWIKKMGFATA